VEGYSVNRQLTERSGGQGRKLLRLLQVNKKHSKNALIFITISIPYSTLYGFSFELRYLYYIWCLVTLKYIYKL
jgi:hypothetical protein